jgi:hypothetical protein
MQFGIGLLGRGWTIEGARERCLANTMAPRWNFAAHASTYAAKVAAETVLSEVPATLDLSDAGLVVQLANCCPPIRPGEAPMVREAFLSEYGHMTEDVAA